MAGGLKKVGVPIFILVGAVVLAIVMAMSRPEPEKKEVETPKFLVDAAPIEFNNVDFLVYAQGPVQPKNRTMLSTQVSGKVVSIADNFIEGGFFNKGDVLVELEAVDYETDLLLAEAELARAQAALEEEIARGRVAEKEWSSFNSGAPPELGLRKPQLAREQANLKAAQANFQRAKRNLERTKIRAPYDGLVKSRNVDLGQFIPLGGQIGEVFATDVAEVRLPLTDDDVAFIGNVREEQPRVTLSADVAGKRHFWEGRLVRDEAVLDENRRVIYGVVEVTDPYRLNDSTGASADFTPLKFGRFVSAEISGVQMNDIVKLPRFVLRLDGTVLTVDENSEIQINQVDVVRTDEDFVYIGGGLERNHDVVLSAVSNPYDGMPVRTLDEPPSESDSSSAVKAQVNANEVN
uniref:efflux RND transporter periplasmic adaptor subunit n=1 Tax=Ningiella ruwaisensis TaxID=2364274 RepID=UPI0010A00561|nr:efflux RND transporter periplasmic adaptor subunit [Ningiella ruwaisensis]